MEYTQFARQLTHREKSKEQNGHNTGYEKTHKEAIHGWSEQIKQTACSSRKVKKYLEIFQSKKRR